jgi:hypothetical protein
MLKSSEPLVWSPCTTFRCSYYYEQSIIHVANMITSIKAYCLYGNGLYSIFFNRCAEPIYRFFLHTYPDGI